MSNVVWSPTKGWHDGPAVDNASLVAALASPRAVRAMHRVAAAPRQAAAHGHCLSCGALEVRLTASVGTTDYSSIGESGSYPIGYGCELCDG